MENQVMTKPQLPTEDELMQRVALCPADLREWAEKEGYANLSARIASCAVIGAQAATTMALLLAGLGGALAAAARVVEPGAGPVAWGAAALCAWMMLCAGVLVVRCINLESAPMLNNQPDNLLVPGVTLEQLRMGELVNLVVRIRQQTAINDRRAKALNQVRWAALASPAVFLLAALAACRF